MIADTAWILQAHIFGLNLLFNRSRPVIRSPPILNLMELLDTSDDFYEFFSV